MNQTNRLDEFDVEGLSFHYLMPDRRGTVLALDDVSLGVRGGEILGLVGHNGAGKSTLLAVAAGLLEPASGTASLDGLPAASWVGSGRVGLLTERLRLYSDFSVAETLHVFAKLQDVPDETTAVGRIVDLLALGALEDTWVGTLSTGLRKRVALGVVLLSDPDLLLLDEPYAGLDPESVDVVSSTIAALARSGCAVIVASHDLPELEEVVHHLVVLKHGRTLAMGAMDDMRAMIGATGGLCAETSEGPFPLPTALGELIPCLQELERRGVMLRSIHERRVSLANVYAHLHRTGNGRVVV